MIQWALSMLALCFVASKSAQSRPTFPNPRIIDPLRLTCILRDQKFFTEITFNRNADGELVGEMDNYVTIGEHGRRFLNGAIFFDIHPTSRLIMGSTGDRRGVTNSFKLTPVRDLTGYWLFEQEEKTGAPLKARFTCKYADES
jgi:hypothetical protein